MGEDSAKPSGRVRTPSPTADDEPSGRTTQVDDTPVPGTGTIQTFTLTIAEGPGAGTSHTVSSEGCAVGSHPLNEVVIEDPTVSRFHCELRIDRTRVRITDLNSKNGTIVDGVVVRDAYLRGGSLIRLGRAVLTVSLGSATSDRVLSERSRFGALVGSSAAMRSVFELLQRVAEADITVLLDGETGTGKGKAAEAIHAASARRDQPLVVVDCGTIPENLLESELFGHEKGAFTSAESRRIGAFEEADGGTIFLDEIGEIPIPLQSKLLRALESREIRRVGSNRHLPIDVRVIAATNRDLRAEVNEGQFRPDLYYRLAVATIRMPPLRERLEDIPEIAAEMIRPVRASEEAKRRVLASLAAGPIRRGRWPGNVRELRNFVERALLFPEGEPPREPPPSQPASEPAPTGELEPFSIARKQAIARFERTYLETLLARHDNKVADAAEEAGVDRVYLYRLLRRNAIKPSGSG